MGVVGERLARLMAAHGDTCRSAAERCGIDHTTVVRVRRGATENPDTLAKIADGYGVTAAWLRGARDVRTDFRLHVLTRPPEERLQLLWDAGQRFRFTLRFLQECDPDRFSPERIAGAVGAEVSALEAALTERVGAAAGAGLVGEGGGDWLQRLSDYLGIPRMWFIAGILELDETDAIQPSLMHHVLQAMADRLGVRMSHGEIDEIVAHLV